VHGEGHDLQAAHSEAAVLHKQNVGEEQLLHGVGLLVGLQRQQTADLVGGLCHVWDHTSLALCESADKRLAHDLVPL
jgi:hypothetical protein